MSPLYSLFGLRFAANRAIPTLAELPFGQAVDIQVWLGQSPAWVSGLRGTSAHIFYTSPDLDESGKPRVTVWKIDHGLHFRILYADGTEFIIDRQGSRIWGTWSESSTFEDTTVYLLGPILGFVLRLRGLTCLHASAVAIGNQAIALLGPPGAGKSTTAAALGRLGHAILSDNVVALRDQGSSFMVHPGFPHLYLRPDSVQLLCGSAEALPRVTPNWDKRYLAVNNHPYRFENNPLPLVAVYILGEGLTGIAEPMVQAVPPLTSFMTLVANSYMNYLLDEAMRAREFELLGRLATNVPVRQVRPHTDLAYLSRLCEIILDDFQSFVSTPLASGSARTA